MRLNKNYGLSCRFIFWTPKITSKYSIHFYSLLLLITFLNDITYDYNLKQLPMTYKFYCSSFYRESAKLNRDVFWFPLGCSQVSWHPCLTFAKHKAEEIPGWHSGRNLNQYLNNNKSIIWTRIKINVYKKNIKNFLWNYVSLYSVLLWYIKVYILQILQKRFRLRPRTKVHGTPSWSQYVKRSRFILIIWKLSTSTSEVLCCTFWLWELFYKGMLSYRFLKIVSKLYSRYVIIKII